MFITKKGKNNMSYYVRFNNNHDGLISEALIKRAMMIEMLRYLRVKNYFDDDVYLRAIVLLKKSHIGK